MGTARVERTDGAHSHGATRLPNKTTHETIIHPIGQDVNLTPIVVGAYFSQVCTCFSQHADIGLSTQQVCYEGVLALEVVRLCLDLLPRDPRISERPAEGSIEPPTSPKSTHPAASKEVAQTLHATPWIVYHPDLIIPPYAPPRSYDLFQ